MTEPLTFAKLMDMLKARSSGEGPSIPPYVQQPATPVAHSDSALPPRDGRGHSASTGKRRSDIFRPGDLKYDGTNEDGTTPVYGRLPPLHMPRDEAYRRTFGDSVDLYGENLTDESRDTEMRIRGKMLEAASKTLTPFSGDEDDWFAWRDRTITAITVAGRRMVLDENFAAKASDAG